MNIGYNNRTGCFTICKKKDDSLSNLGSTNGDSSSLQWRVATWNTPGYTTKACIASSCDISHGSDPTCDETALTKLVENLKNIGMIGTDINKGDDDFITNLLKNNMPWHADINPYGNKNNPNLVCPCSLCRPGGCISFPETQPSKYGPWLAFYHSSINTDKCTTNCYPKGGIDWFNSRWDLWEPNLGKFMSLPDPTNNSKKISAIMSNGHGSFGGKCGDIALYKLVSSDGKEGYIINLQNGPRTWSLELSQNEYVNQFIKGYTNYGGYAGIPVGIPLSGFDENNKQVDSNLDVFDYSSNPIKLKYPVSDSPLDI